MEVEKQFTIITTNWNNSKNGLFDYYRKVKDEFDEVQTTSYCQELKMYRDIVRGFNVFFNLIQFCKKQPFQLRDNFDYVCDLRLKEEYSETQ